MASSFVKLFSKQQRRDRRARYAPLGRGRQSRREALSVAEPLEPRRLMAIDSFVQTAEGAIADGWVTIIANDGDDVYVQRAATKAGDLLVANNASFLNPTYIPGIDDFSDVFVVNATRVDVVDQEADEYPLLPFPRIDGQLSRETYHVLPWNFSEIDFFDPISGVISNGDGNGDGVPDGQWSFNVTQLTGNAWTFFLPGGTGNVQLVDLLPNGSPSVGPFPIRASFGGNGVGFTLDDNFGTWLDVEWNNAPPNATPYSPSPAAVVFNPEAPPVLDSISADLITTPGFTPESFSNVVASSSATPEFTLPFGPGSGFGEIVSGTLSGTLSVGYWNNLAPTRLEFTTQTLYVDANSPLDRIPLVFRELGSSGLPIATFAVNRTFQNASGETRIISGTLDPRTGVVSLGFRVGGVGGSSVATPVGPVTIETATFARFDAPTVPSAFTLFPGQDFVPSLTVDLSAPGSTISIESPIVDAPFIDLRATNVIFDARVSSDSTLSVGPSQFGVPVNVAASPSKVFDVVNVASVIQSGERLIRFVDLPRNVADQLLPGAPLLIVPADGGLSGQRLIRRVTSVRVSGSDTFITLNRPIDTTATTGSLFYDVDEFGTFHAARTLAEQAFFNAAVAAKAFDVRLGDDIQTSAAKRSKLFVSATGSLAGSLPTTGPTSEDPFDTLYALVNTGDILVEGVINGTRQSYILQSPAEGVDGVDHRGPYYFSTTSLVSGGDTGLLQGGTAAITLGNDLPTLYDNVSDGGASAFNIVTLQTELTNLRVQASDKRGNALRTPFPYDLRVSEADDIVVDAVAASALPISIVAGDDIDFRATLASASDITIEAGGKMELNAPLSTVFGAIRLTGDDLTISNSVRVLDTFSDEFLTDIVLTAKAGDMRLVGAISAINAVELLQDNLGLGAGGGKIDGNARIIADGLFFRSSGSVSLQTDVRLIDGTAGSSVSLLEANTAYFKVVAPGSVSLQADGTDVQMSNDLLAMHVGRGGITASVTVTAANKFTLPAGYAGLARLYVGQGLRALSGTSIVPVGGNPVASIAAIAPPNANGVVEVTIANGTLVTGEILDVQFGMYVNFDQNLDVIDVPVGALSDQLSVGVALASDLLPAGTFIKGFNTTTGKLTLSDKPLGSGVAEVVLSQPVALWGEVRGASSLFLSAPNGSIDIFVPTSDTVVVGSKQDLAIGTAQSMQAAGAVTIRSLGGSIDVLDAPVAGLAATAVRAVATSQVAPAVDLDYRNNRPGTFPATLERKTAGGVLVVDGVALRARDRVLLTRQDDPRQNGVYVVVNAGSTSIPWRLARVSAFDTTVEMTENTKFRVTEGTQAGRLFSLTRYDNVLGSTPISVKSSPNRAGAFPVAAVSTLTLVGATYTSGAAAEYIESDGNGSLPFAAFDGVMLQKDDFVLVRLGVASGTGSASASANGVYRVDNPGGGLQKWKLTRVSADEFDIGLGGFVVVDNGSLRSRVTGNGFQVGYDSLGSAGMTIADVSQHVTTDIGSDNFNSLVTFVVSTNGGLNTAAGSLGKMLLIAQQNVATDPVSPSEPQTSTFRFGNTVSRIQLAQQLPAITRKIELDGGSSRYAVTGVASSQIEVDGSRITLLSNGRPRLAANKINGIEVVGAGASGSKLASFRIYGFTRGAAVRLNGNGQFLNSVLVQGMQFGVDGAGKRVANASGIQVVGSVGGFTTLSRNFIAVSSTAGIEVLNGGGSDGVRIVGNEIGRSQFENGVGIKISAGVNRQNRIGLENATDSVSRVTVTYETPTSLLLPAGFTDTGSFYVGMGVSGTGITVTSPTAAVASIASINRVTLNNEDRVRIVLDNGTIKEGAGSFVANFGAFVAFTVGEKVIPLPTGITSVENLFLGQLVSSTNLPTQTVIVAIDRVGGTITLSKEPITSITAAISFESAPRNALAYNLRGITLAGGKNAVIATTVSNSVFEGIAVTGGEARIGARGVTALGGRVTAKDLAATSNRIFGSGGAGILVGPSVVSDKVIIQGNYLGVDGTSRNALANRGGNIVFAGLAPGLPVVAPAGLSFTRVGTVVTVTSSGHGLVTGHKVYVTGFHPASTGSAAGYTITRLDNDRFTFSLTTEPAVGTATTGTLSIEKYGPAGKLPLVDNRDFEGNAHGVSLSSTGGGAGGGGVIPPRGRPIVSPPRRR